MLQVYRDTVTKAGVNLTCIYLFKGGTKLLEYFTKLVVNAEVHGVVLKSASYKELHAEIAYLLTGGSLNSLLECLAVFKHDVLESKEGCLIKLIGSSLMSIENATGNKLGLNSFLKLLLCNGFFVSC